jgi:hypothetical protein
MSPKKFEELLSTIGAKLIQLRKDKGYKNSGHFALDHNLPPVQYWRLENGKANFTLKLWQRY